MLDGLRVDEGRIDESVLKQRQTQHRHHGMGQIPKCRPRVHRLPSRGQCGIPTALRFELDIIVVVDGGADSECECECDGHRFIEHRLPQIRRERAQILILEICRECAHQNVASLGNERGVQMAAFEPFGGRQAIV